MTGKKATTAVDLARAEELKRTLRDFAADRNLDLSIQANQWTLWRRTPGTIPDNIDFVRNAASLGELFFLVAQKQSYVFQMLEDVLILKAEGKDRFIVREYSYAEG